MKSSDIYRSERDRYPAPYAALSQDSRGRKYPIPRNVFRTDFQRDRDRIIHSTAFRRLQHKTQVFANLGDENDHYRTRLSHTIEVAQISRTIARMLGLNEELAEAVALAHDLGHTPFGHAGEEVLGALMWDYGGFNHNHQSLRVVDYLEKRYPGHFGLNLTFEVREGIIKHETNTDLEIPEEFRTGENPLLECQLINLADEIAYNGHDIDDGLASGLLTFEMIAENESLGPVLETVQASTAEKTPHMIRFALVRNLVNRMVTDLVDEITKRLRDHNIDSVAAVRSCEEKLVSFSEPQNIFNHDVMRFLRYKMYKHERLGWMTERSSEIITFLFTYYHEHIEEMSRDFRERFPDQRRQRLVADYIAGMTDRFALTEFNRLNS